MRLGYILFIICSFCILACSKKAENRLLSPSNLESWTFTVDANTDSVFKTPKGALLKIQKGTFDREVKLEVKEAYTMRDILLGGLVTESNGRPLSSGGMIYLNSSDKSELDILKPIEVALPTRFVDPDMQLFKGESIQDTINWVQPDTLPENGVTANIEMGKQLFQQNCRSCHYIDRGGTGPALRGFRNRGPWSNPVEFRKFIRNPTAFISQSDYARNLVSQYGTIMQAFPSLSNSQIDAIGAYLDNEENNPSAEIDSLIGNEGICWDTVYLNNSDSVLDLPALEPELLEQQRSAIDSTTGWFDRENTPVPTGAYIFQITTTGWFNIDKLVDDTPGAVPCEIEVQLSPSDTLSTVYLLLPAQKIMISPGRNDAGGFYFGGDGQELIIQPGTDGIIVAFNGTDKEFYFGAQQFSIGRKQKLTINMKKGEEQDFKKLLQNKRLEVKQREIVESDSLFLESVNAIDNDLTRDSLKMIQTPCGTRDTTGYAEAYRRINEN